VKGAEITLGEAWEFLRSLPSESVDGLVTDPPYSSGGFTRGDRMSDPGKKYRSSGAAETTASFSGDNRDQRSYLRWCALWLTEAHRAMVDGGRVVIATDWRQLPTTCDALQVAGFMWRGIVTWTKLGASRPQQGRFRGDAEFFVWGSKGPMPLEGKPLPGTFTSDQDELAAAELAVAPVPSSRRLHLTEKPVAVMEAILEIVRPGGLVVDPFMGSGTTGAAAIRRGHPFRGCELSPEYFEIASRRLDAERAGVDGTAAARDAQAVLFAGAT